MLRGMPRLKLWQPSLPPWGSTPPLLWPTSRPAALWTSGRIWRTVTNRWCTSGRSTTVGGGGGEGRGLQRVDSGFQDGKGSKSRGFLKVCFLELKCVMEICSLLFVSLLVFVCVVSVRLWLYIMHKSRLLHHWFVLLCSFLLALLLSYTVYAWAYVCGLLFVLFFNQALFWTWCWPSPVARCQLLHGVSHHLPLWGLPYPQTREGECDSPVESGPGMLHQNQEHGDGQRQSPAGDQDPAGRHQPANLVCLVS